MSSNSGPFESINARTLSASQVAETFVLSSHFTELCRPRHSILLGPRGSGKTTLLKMLQPAALNLWKHVSAEEVATSIDFTAIYVATDISWSEQLNLLGNGSLEPEGTKQLALACFNTHSLRAVVTAFQQRILAEQPDVPRRVRAVALKPGAESAIVRDIAKVWHVEDISPSLHSLRQALTQRLVKIREFSNREAVLGPTGRPERVAAEQYLHLPFLQAAAAAIEIFEDHAGLESGKWGYSFDELELAPETVQRELIQSIRSSDERFLFKLALNPFTTNNAILQTAQSPAPGQDFDQIALWYAEKRSAHAFCDDLWKELAKQHGVPSWSPKDVLGASYFESSTEDVELARGAYAPGSRWAKRFESLSKKDASFRRYLKRRKIDIAGLHLLDEDTRAAEVRKIAPVVALRDFYLRSDVDGGDTLSARSRKTASLYTGADSIFSLTEGNPRIFIGLVGSLLSFAKRRPNKLVPPRVQADQLLAAAEKFVATLRTIPTGSFEAGADFGVMNLLEKTAEYFHDDAVGANFHAAPVGGFTVDTRIPEGVVQVLGQALNTGAIIYVPDDEGKVILTSLRSRKFRLSYLLAPLFGFPIRIGREIELSKILGLRKEIHERSSLSFEFEDSE